MTLKEQLEKYMNNAFRKAMYDEFKNTYLSGFQDAMQLLYPLVEALEECNGEWCQHSQIRLKENKNLHRDFCCDCHTWIYRDEVNPASKALQELKEKLK